MTNLFKRISLFLLLSCVSCLSYSQIGIGTNTPDPSAILTVQDTARGMLIPRMTAAQRINIQNPAEGLMVYQLDNPSGFWYFRSGQWINTFPSNGGGRPILVLADTITDTEAQLKIANEVGPNTQEIRIMRCTNLTTVNLSMITTSLVEIYITDNAVLQNVNLGNLTAIDGGILVNNCPQLTTLSIAALGRIGQTFGGSNGLIITGTGVQNINLPSLKQVTGYIQVKDNPALTNLNMPQLIEHPSTNNTSFTISNCPLIATSSFHALKHVGYFSMTATAPVLATADFSSLMTIGSTFTLTGNQLPSISFPVLTNVTTSLQITGQQLASASFPVLQVCPTLYVNASQISTISAPLLATCSSFNLTGGTISSINLNSLQLASVAIAVSGGSVTLPALQYSPSFTISGAASFSFPVMHKSNFFQATSISSLSVPLLDTASHQLYIHNCPSLSMLSFPALKQAGMLSIHNCGITSVSFPALTDLSDPYWSFFDVEIDGNPNLTSISFPNLQRIGNGSGPAYGRFNNNKLSSSAVNVLLAKFANMASGPTGSIGVNGFYLKQTPAAPPTGQGISDKAYLQSLFYLVDTD